MRETLFTNWRLKLLSLLLAAAFLVFVRGERAREEMVNIEKRVPVRVVHKGAPPLGFRLEQVVADPAQVMVAGPRRHVDRVTSIATEEISVHARMKTLDREETLVVSGPGLRVVPSRVTVKTVISPIIERRRLNALAVQLLVESDHKFQIHITPNTIDIDVEGPVSQVATLREADVQATVDLRGRHFVSPTAFDAAARVDNLPIDVRPIGFNPKKFRVSVTKRR